MFDRGLAPDRPGKTRALLPLRPFALVRISRARLLRVRPMMAGRGLVAGMAVIPEPITHPPLPILTRDIMKGFAKGYKRL